MKIVVCIKQVPDLEDVSWSADNTINTGVEGVLNPFDEFAIEAALKIKDSTEDVQVIALSVGDLESKSILERAIAMGCDDAILISDEKLKKADSQMRAKVLSRAILSKIPDFALVFCGQFSIDGMSGNVGPSLAQYLGVPQVSYVKEMILLPQNKILVTKQTEYGLEKLKMQLPALVCTIKGVKPRKFTVGGVIKAQNSTIDVYNLDDIFMDNFDEEDSSFTTIYKTFLPKNARKCQFLEESSMILSILEGKNV